MHLPFCTTLPRLILSVFLLFLSTGCSVTSALRVQDRETIGVDTMIGEMKDAQVVLIGERHDVPAHHRLQLEVIQQLAAEGKTVAIGMEMFEGVAQPALDAWSSGKVPEEAFRKVFAWNWRNLSFELYRDILIFARDRQIPLIALNAPRSLVQKVSQSGIVSLNDAEFSELPPGIDLTVTPQYLDFMSRAYPVHGRGGTSFRYICEAQLVRNRVMARRVTDYLAAHPEATVVVLAGGGHARVEGGIPAELGSLPYRVVLPAVEGLGKGNVSRRDGDYLIEEPPSWFEWLSGSRL